MTPADPQPPSRLRAFLRRERWLLLPLVVVLVLGALLLIATGGLSQGAPLIYAIF